MRKFILITMCAGLLLSTGCEKQKRVPKQTEIELSFQYREVGNKRIEFRNTSTPDYMLSDDMWYYFSTTAAPAIGNGAINLGRTGITDVNMLYKPAIAPEPNAICASRSFQITLTGVVDSIWINAEPK